MQQRRRVGGVVVAALVLGALTLLSCQAPNAVLERLLPPTATPTTVPTPTTMPTPVPQASSMLSLEEEIIGIYQEAGQGVVNITNRSYAYDFFMQVVPQEGSGSGFVYDDQGHIVTNYH
ncbi:MAG: serine protease, partial [Chloroflexi bacterium]|nr:serine protease [Chloroflexota bacterium]